MFGIFGKLQQIISVVLWVQAVMFFITSQSTHVVCRLQKTDPSFIQEELGPIVDQIPQTCYQYPDIIHSASDALVENKREQTKKLVKYYSENIIALGPAFSTLYASGILQTYALNLLFYWYLVYVPYMIVRKAISITIWLSFYAAFALVVVYLLSDKWQSSYETIISKATEMKR